MDKKVNIQIANYLEQWVGYWGYGNQTKLSQSLQLILQQKEENKNWYISSDIPPDGILATLSASGLSFDFTNNSLLPDAWVKIAENRLILGREAFGRVPLYWLQQEEVIWFTSRFQLLLPLVTSPNINLAALYGYSCFSYVPQPLTPIENIYSLTAGTEQIWKIDQQKKILFSTSHERQIWQIKTPIIYHEKEAIPQLQALLKASIERQIVDLKDKTVGVFLSGGLDSSIVATLLVQAGVKVRAYSLDFGDEFTEYSYAEQVAQWLKIPLIKVDVTPKRIKAALIPTIQALDLPFGDGVTVPSSDALCVF
jgi:asparagine synthase (glutamine-hydrolysing)